MTVTETRPETSEETQPPATATRAEPGGVLGYLGTGDHKKIGRTYLGFALVFLLGTVALAALVAAESADLDGLAVFSASTFFQTLTLAATMLPFLVLFPLFLGLAIYVVPLQVGSRSIAFPRAASASLWGFILGGSMVLASYGIDGGPGGSDANGIDLYVVSFGLLVLSLLAASLCVVTTVITMRTPAMTLDRVPIFSWSMLVAGAMWLLTLPVLLASLALIYVDHRYGQVGIGGDVELYRWIHWVFRQPQVLLFAVPALGIVGEIVPVMADTRQRMHKAVMALITMVGVLGFGAASVGVWASVVVDVANQNRAAGYHQWMFVAMLLLAPVPVLLLLGGWADAVRRGRGIRLTASTGFALCAVLLLVAGTSAAAVAAIRGLGFLTTTWVVGASLLVMGGALLGGFAGLQYWSVKIWGRLAPEGSAYLTALLLLVGGFLAGLGHLIAGGFDQADLAVLWGNPRSAFDGILIVRRGAQTGNVVSAIGWVILAAAVLVFFFGFLSAVFRRRQQTPADPWVGQTLEWAVSSPPPPHNFDEVALVTSAAPLLDEREARIAKEAAD